MCSMKNLQEYVMEAEAQVYAVKDETDAILGVFDTKEEAEDNLKTWPKESNAKIITMKKSEVEG